MTCEDCGKVTTLQKSLDGTMQELRHCYAYVDVGNRPLGRRCGRSGRLSLRNDDFPVHAVLWSTSSRQLSLPIARYVALPATTESILNTVFCIVMISTLMCLSTGCYGRKGSIRLSLEIAKHWCWNCRLKAMNTTGKPTLHRR